MNNLNFKIKLSDTKIMFSLLIIINKEHESHYREVKKSVTFCVMVNLSSLP